MTARRVTNWTHPDFCTHDEPHRGTEIRVPAEHPGDPSFTVTPEAYPDNGEDRGYAETTLLLHVIRDDDTAAGDVEVFLYPGTAQRLVAALEKALAAVQADDGAHPLDAS